MYTKRNESVNKIKNQMIIEVFLKTENKVTLK